MKNEHVMIDFETLGTTADSVIMSIGAVRFDLDSDHIDDAAFYTSISIESNLERNRRISESTLIWWMGQDAAAKTVFTEPKQPLEQALASFDDWFTEGKSTYIWSNGADFDIAMLAHAYTQFGWEPPWQFWNARCVRTYKNLPGAKGIAIPNTAKHNALHDAIAQTKLVQAIQRKLATAHPMIKA